MLTERAIVLARGLGTRMRAPDSSARLTPEQQRAAEGGVKAMMPLNGHPFLDFILSSLADAGIRRVALVVAPDHSVLSRHYQFDTRPERVGLEFVVQEEPVGTANAVLAAETWVAGEPFLAMNADNLYPVPVLAELASLPEPGLPAFEADDLVRSSNIPAERISSFAMLDVDDSGYLLEIVEKPDKLPPATGGSNKTKGEGGHKTNAQGGRQNAGLPPSGGRLISMNCWRFDRRIFDACREVPKSARGEFELPEAVGLAVRRGVGFKTFPARGPVLDLSTRADAADVARRLAATTPRP
ncbi:MAG: nucleotidyltransferase family protein [Vicinamibacterales bacterium]